VCPYKQTADVVMEGPCVLSTNTLCPCVHNKQHAMSLCAGYKHEMPLRADYKHAVQCPCMKTTNTLFGVLVR